MGPPVGSSATRAKDEEAGRLEGMKINLTLLYVPCQTPPLTVDMFSEVLWLVICS